MHFLLFLAIVFTAYGFVIGSQVCSLFAAVFGLQLLKIWISIV
jgi:hypothetical protein|tara:strand:- start:160 stop:288 length:129 start_codon:yes stop_codon:yes gene_type:complete